MYFYFRFFIEVYIEKDLEIMNDVYVKEWLVE